MTPPCHGASRLPWAKLRFVRVVRFHAFEPVRIAPLGDPWPRHLAG